MHLSHGKLEGQIALIHHSKVEVEENVLDTAVPTSSVHLPEVSKNALSTSRKVIYPV